MEGGEEEMMDGGWCRGDDDRGCWRGGRVMERR